MESDGGAFWELKGIVNSHISQCGDFRKALWAVFSVAVVLNMAGFGYMIRIADSIRDNQAELKNSQMVIDRALMADRADVTNRLTTIVQANLQRESNLNEKLKGVEISILEMKKELKEELKRDRDRR